MSTAIVPETIRSDFKRILKSNSRDMRDWLVRNDNRNFMFDKPKARFEKFCRDGDDNLNVIGSRLRNMAT